MFVADVKSAGETIKLGEALGKMLQPGSVICLLGDLGVGKTCLARGIARGVGVNQRVTSPTFTLINEYMGRMPLYHMDVYRLAKPEELEELGYEEYFYGDGATLVEWADLIQQYLPGQRLDIYIERAAGDEQKRIVKLVPRGASYERLVEELMRRVRSGH